MAEGTSPTTWCRPATAARPSTNCWPAGTRGRGSTSSTPACCTAREPCSPPWYRRSSVSGEICRAGSPQHARICSRRGRCAARRAAEQPRRPDARALLGRFAPPGKSVIHCTYFSDYDYWKTLRRTDRRAVLGAQTGGGGFVRRFLEQRYPGAAPRIELVDVASPATTRALHRQPQADRSSRGSPSRGRRRHGGPRQQGPDAAAGPRQASPWRASGSGHGRPDPGRVRRPLRRPVPVQGFGSDFRAWESAGTRAVAHRQSWGGCRSSTAGPRGEQRRVRTKKGFMTRPARAEKP